MDSNKILNRGALLLVLLPLLAFAIYTHETSGPTDAQKKQAAENWDNRFHLRDKFYSSIKKAECFRLDYRNPWVNNFEACIRLAQPE